MSVINGPNIIRDGLVLHLDAANVKSYPGTGIECVDLINGFKGILSHESIFIESSIREFTFNGTNNNINLGNILNNVFSGTNNTFTVSLWVKGNGTGVNLLAKHADGNLSSNERNISINYREGGKFDIVLFEVPGTTGWYRVIQTTNIYPYNTWYNLTVTYDGAINSNNGLDRVLFYVNGVSVPRILWLTFGTLTNSMAGSIAPLSIGSLQNSTNNRFGYFNGSIPNVQIYNRVLTASEVLQNFNAYRSRYGL